MLGNDLFLFRMMT